MQKNFHHKFALLINWAFAHSNVQASCHSSSQFSFDVWISRDCIYCVSKKDDALSSALELIDEDNRISDLSSSFIESLLSRFIESARVLAFHSFFNFFMLCLNSCSAATTVFWSSNKTKSWCTICSFSDNSYARKQRQLFKDLQFWLHIYLKNRKILQRLSLSIAEVVHYTCF